MQQIITMRHHILLEQERLRKPENLPAKLAPLVNEIDTIGTKIGTALQILGMPVVDRKFAVEVPHRDKSIKPMILEIHVESL